MIKTRDIVKFTINKNKQQITKYLFYRKAIEEGKGIFYNIRNFVSFQLSTLVNEYLNIYKLLNIGKHSQDDYKCKIFASRLIM